MHHLPPILHRVIPIIIFFILLALYIQFLGPIPFSVTSTNKSDSFNVTGEGKVSVKPDIAVVRAGVVSTAPTVEAAQEQLNSNINKVTEAIKKLGIDSKDIQTDNYSIYPNYDNRPTITGGGQQKIIGYSANTDLVIKVRDIEKANSVIDSATQNGANQVGGIQFEVNDKTKAENEAREKAVVDAKRKATDASRIAGFKLGKIINYQEGFGGGVIPMSYDAKARNSEAAGGDTPTQVEPGSSEVRVTVTLSYEVR